METRILIADNCPALRLGLFRLLSEVQTFQVVGSAVNLGECFEKIETLNPDVVVLDLELDDSSADEAIKKLYAQHPNNKTIIYTSLDNEWTVYEVIKSGVQGYVLKKSTIDNLIKAIQEVSLGEYYLDPVITSKFIQVTGLLNTRKYQHCTITERETQILQLVAKGYKNKNIAKSLSITESTVKYHLKSIFTKLSVNSRIEAVLAAKKQGMLQEKAS